MYNTLETLALPFKGIDNDARWIRAQQIGMVFRNTTLALAGGTVASFTLVALLWNEVDQHILLLWLAASCTLTLVRLGLNHRFTLQQPSLDDLEPWRRLFFVSVFMAGCVWGSLAIFLFPEESLYHQTYVMLVLGGVCSGAVTVYAPLAGSYTLFALPILLPFAARFWGIGSDEAQLMALLLAMFHMMLQRMATEGRKMLGAVLDLQIRNADLTRALHHRATHDSLVDLVNHGEFNRRLEKLARDDQHEPSEYSLIFLDLDLFKQVNDTGGHAAGDMLLKAVAEVLRQHVRSSDTAARVGGDEFALLLESCPKEKALSLAEKIRAEITELRVEYDGETYQVGASAGISWGLTGLHTSAAMLRAADAACYSAKQEGRNLVRMNAASNMYQTTGRFELTQAMTPRNPDLTQSRSQSLTMSTTGSLARS